MPAKLADLGMSIANQATGGLLGMVFGGLNDQRQLRQQQALQDMQLAGNKQMMDYSMKKQLEMWEATNYSAQRKQLEKAGLNPGLLYGMSGGGGVTTGSPGGSVQGGNAPVGGGEIMGMALQSALVQAQIENVKAQTEKTKAETGNVPLTGKNIEASTANLLQGIDNAKAQAAYTRAQTEFQDIQNDIQGSEINDLKGIIKYGMRKVYAEMLSQEVTANVDQKTQADKIKLIQAQASVEVLKKYLTSAQTANINQDTKNKIQELLNDKQALTNMVGELAIKWNQLSLQERQFELQRMLGLSQDDELNKGLDRIVDMFNNIFVFPFGKTDGPTRKMDR